jgi:hypothetical protein
MKATWRIAVVYEDSKARATAVQLCDLLVERFWSLYSFDLSWWSFDDLKREHVANEAAGSAAGVDLLIFSAHPETNVPPDMERWNDTWLSLRNRREGWLLGLVGQGNGAEAKHDYLRKAAHHAGMDYLMELPEDLPHRFSDSMESYTERARQMSGVLEQILHTHHTPASVLSPRLPLHRH